jgi:hypothetical protein
MFQPSVHLRFYRLLICCAGAVSLNALAADLPSVSPSVLATAEATTDFCAKANPPAADRYREQARPLLRGVSKDQVAEIRASTEYRRAYDSTTELIAKGSQEDALQACVDSLETR